MKGFTLVEALVAVAILSLAVTAPLYSASRSMVAANNSSYQLSASYLAQEGIEYVRMMRDNEYLVAYDVGGPDVSSNAWSAFRNGPLSQCVSPRICTLDPTLPVGLVQCPGDICTPLYLITAEGKYVQSSGSGRKIQPFVRTIQATPLSANDEEIVSTVTWFFHGVTYSVRLVEHLTPWQ